MNLGPYLDIAKAACQWCLAQPDIAEFTITEISDDAGIWVTITWQPPGSPCVVEGQSIVTLGRSLLKQYAPPARAVELLAQKAAAVREAASLPR